jgi:sulfatase maturation enzyme AslB (radical SAM superfamily)
MKQQRKLQLFSVEKRKRKIHEIVYERKLLLYSCNRYLLTNSYDTVNNQSSKQASKAKQSKAKQSKKRKYSTVERKQRDFFFVCLPINLVSIVDRK